VHDRRLLPASGEVTDPGNGKAPEDSLARTLI
jgi:hypothetical protein